MDISHKLYLHPQIEKPFNCSNTSLLSISMVVSTLMLIMSIFRYPKILLQIDVSFLIVILIYELFIKEIIINKNYIKAKYKESYKKEELIFILIFKLCIIGAIVRISLAIILSILYRLILPYENEIVIHGLIYNVFRNGIGAKNSFNYPVFIIVLVISIIAFIVVFKQKGATIDAIVYSNNLGKSLSTKEFNEEQKLSIIKEEQNKVINKVKGIATNIKYTTTTGYKESGIYNLLSDKKIKEEFNTEFGSMEYESNNIIDGVIGKFKNIDTEIKVDYDKLINTKFIDIDEEKNNITKFIGTMSIHEDTDSIMRNNENIEQADIYSTPRYKPSIDAGVVYRKNKLEDDPYRHLAKEYDKYVCYLNKNMADLREKDNSIRKLINNFTNQKTNYIQNEDKLYYREIDKNIKFSVKPKSVQINIKEQKNNIDKELKAYNMLMEDSIKKLKKIDNIREN